MCPPVGILVGVSAVAPALLVVTVILSNTHETLRAHRLFLLLLLLHFLRQSLYIVLAGFELRVYLPMPPESQFICLYLLPSVRSNDVHYHTQLELTSSTSNKPWQSSKRCYFWLGYLTDKSFITKWKTHQKHFCSRVRYILCKKELW